MDDRPGEQKRALMTNCGRRAFIRELPHLAVSLWLAATS
jgi:hypothetical protein